MARRPFTLANFRATNVAATRDATGGNVRLMARLGAEADPMEDWIRGWLGYYEVPLTEETLLGMTAAITMWLAATTDGPYPAARHPETSRIGVFLEALARFRAEGEE